MPKSGVCTIVAKNYLAQARVLMESVRKHDPECVRIVFLVDRIEGYFDPLQESFEVVTSEDLDLPEPRWFHFKYTVLELSTGIKPYALEFAMRRYGLDKILYLDADIKTYGSLSEIFRILDGHSIVLTPHLTGPLEDEFRPSELDILRSGAYNLGFIGIARGEETQRFLKWWQARLYDYCVVDLPRGLFVDQKWIDLVPGIFTGVFVLREPGYNVAYWNLGHRTLDRSGGEWRVNGTPLRFFHFSGLDPDDPESVSRHQNRHRLGGLGEVAALVAEYREDLKRNGYRDCRAWPYAYAVFRNGVPIPDAGRRIRDEAPELARIEDPFSDPGFEAFVKHWNEPLPGPRRHQPGMTRLAYKVYRTGDEMQAAMPDVFGGDRLRFLSWLVKNVRPVDSLSGVFLAPAWDALRAAELHVNRTEGSGGGSLPQDLDDRLQLSRLALFIYDSRPDLQRILPDPCGRDAVKFLAWMLTFGMKEHHISGRFAQPLRAQWEEVLRALDGWPERMWYRTLLRGMSWAARLRPHVTRMMPGTRPARINGAVGVARTATNLAAPLSHAQPAGIGLNVLGYLTAETGMAQGGRALVRAAESAGVPVSHKGMQPAGPERAGDPGVGADSAALPHHVNVFRINADQIPYVLSELEDSVWKGKYNIGAWAWELEEFPDCWLRSFTYLNEVWAPSSFCQDAFSRKSPVPVIRIPHGVRLDLAGSPRRADFGWPENKFVFLSVFDMLSVFERKNPMALVEAFQRAFPNSENCQLVIKINHAEQNPEGFKRLCLNSGASIVVNADPYTRAEINGLMNACDCLISLHRSEGFGWTMAEAMFLGKPVIATGYSGNLDYTRPDNSYLVEHRMIRVGEGSAPYDPNALWADPDVEDAARKMREVVENAERRREVASRGQALIQSQFSLERMGALIKSRLERIESIRTQPENAAIWKTTTAAIRQG